MEFVAHSHRFAAPIIESDPLLARRYAEFTAAIESITDEEIMADFIARRRVGKKLWPVWDERDKEYKVLRNPIKSVAAVVNAILRERVLEVPGWEHEVAIFNDESVPERHREWRLDFACDGAFCIEVAFNHQEAICWNLLKPVLACELNHVRKAVQGRVGVYVCATQALKVAGNYDGAVGEYEKVLRYLDPMMNQLTIPIMVLGLLPPRTFRIDPATRSVVFRFDGDPDRLIEGPIGLGLADGRAVGGLTYRIDFIEGDAVRLVSVDGEVETARLSEIETVEVF